MKLIKDLGTKQSKNKQWRRYGIFYCEYCNKEIEKLYHHGIKQKSCGCAQKELNSKINIKHGDTCNNKKLRLYRIWKGMKQRCNNKNNKDYIKYGNRGIKICEQWQKHYIIFKIWALGHGYKDNLTIDRKDNNGNYEPDNCRWITKKDQTRNQSTTKLSIKKARLIRHLYYIKGLNKMEISNIFNVSPELIRFVINNKIWRIEK